MAQAINLQITPSNVMPKIYASQFDIGREIEIILYDGASAYTPPVGTDIRFEGKKPDGNGFSYACTYTGNVVTVVTTDQMTVLAGEIPCELRMSLNGDDIGTLNIIFVIEKSPIDENVPISDTEIPAIVELARDEQYTAEAWAIGERNGVPVGPEDPAYHNNAKYWAEHAEYGALDDLTDVEITTPSDGQALIYDANTDEWVNGDVVDALDDLSDTNITTPTDGQALIYDADNDEWINGDVSTVENLSELADTDITTPTDGDTLVFNGEKWVNSHDELSAIENVYGSKNLCPIESRTIQGFTYAPDKDGYISCSTSTDTRSWGYTYANQKFRLKKGTYFIKIFEKTAYTTGYLGLRVIDSNDSNVLIATWETALSTGQTFTLAADTDIGVEYKLGDGAYAFMIMDNRIKDRTYAPYAPTNRDCMSYAVNTKLGAHNLAPSTATSGTNNGVTYTVNNNKTITATWSSTPTGNALSTPCNQDALTPVLEVGKTYRLTGCPKGGSWESGAYKYRLYVYESTASPHEVAIDTGDGATFTVESEKKYAIWAVVGVNAGSSGNITFAPMITTIEDTDLTYTPHAMTNRELTESVSPIRRTVSNFPTSTGSSYSLYKMGKIGVLQIVAALTDVVADTWTLIGTIEAGARPITAYFFACVNAGTNNAVQGLIETDGSVKINSHTAGTINVRGSITYIIA